MRYKVSFEFETDKPLDFPGCTIMAQLECEFDNLKILSIEEIKNKKRK